MCSVHFLIQLAGVRDYFHYPNLTSRPLRVSIRVCFKLNFGVEGENLERAYEIKFSKFPRSYLSPVFTFWPQLVYKLYIPPLTIVLQQKLPLSI